MAMLKFLKGNYENLNNAAISEGQILIAQNTHEMFVDISATERVKIGDFTVIGTLAALEALDATAVPTSRLYYVEDGNILARSNGTAWVQVNKQPTATEMKALLGLGSAAYTDASAYDAAGAAAAVQKNLDDHIAAAAEAYETKTDAAAKLTEANGYTDTEVGKVQDALNTLDAYVGDIPEEYTEENIVAYINKKAEETLKSATGEGGESAASVLAALNTYKETNDPKVQANADAIKALQEANAEGGAVATAIADAQAAADAAQDEVDALEDKVGVANIPEGETVFSMIQDVQDASSAAMREAQAKVASVEAGDASVTIGGTATAPTVAAKISGNAGNALSLVDDGLMVTIPAAAEYSIVKAEDSGDYAAIYNLTKDGKIVGASINIPKDLVVKSGSVVNGDIVLVLNDEANTEITIPADSLIEYVTSGSAAGDMVVISVSDDHKVTAAITDGTITLAKLDAAVQTEIGKAHTHENAAVLAGITADQVVAWDAAEQNAKDYADGLNGAMDTRVKVVEGKAHEHANKDLLDTYTQTEENLADAVAKKHAHANATELDKVAEGDVEKWNQAVADVATKAAQADLNTAVGRIDALETASATHALKTEVEDVAGDLSAYQTANDEAVALKANAADVYTKDEVDAAVEEAVNNSVSWGTF